MDGRTLRETLHEQMESRSITIPKLAGLTNVPDRFITAIIEGNPNKLPAPPYVRGYLSKIASTLNLDGEVLWELYTKEYTLLRSGAGDTLPINRFAVKAISKTKIVLAVLGIALIVYLGFQAKNLLGVPPLTISNPASSETFYTNQSSIVVSGSMNPRDKLFINGENVVPKQDGSFEKEVALDPNLNTVEFKISRFLGREKIERRQILYQPQQ